jgi:NAD(P)-dependent dehydrogenase (short-subunit alcohol dehydrogenase family)
MELSFSGKVALVTGGSRGIGFAIARRLAEAGASVMLSSRKAEALDAAAAAIASEGGTADWFAADVGSSEDAAACVAATVARFGGIDILVNNAGTNSHHGRVIDIDDRRAMRAVEVNQHAVVTWTGAAWRGGMQDRGGSVINIAAISAMAVYRNSGWYGGTKAAMIQLTQQMAYELAPGVRVNAIAPGVVETDFGRANVEEYGLTELAEQLRQRTPEAVAERLPLRRVGTPDDIAYAALYLASDAASWVTGQTLAVDGGALTLPRL